MIRASLLSLLLFSTTLQLSSAQKSKPGANGSKNTPKSDPSIENYPRPMLLRPAWESLNGSWNFTTKQDANKPPTKWDDKIQIPQSNSKPSTGPDVHWYRLQLPTPKPPPGKRAFIRFESISGDALVFANGSPVATSSGSDSTLSLDLTDLLTETPTQEISVSLRPSEASTSVGIHGTVWLEIIPRTHINKLKISPNPSKAEVTVFAQIWGQANFRPLEFQVLDGENKIAEGSAFYHYEKGGYETVIKVANSKHWSPDSPKLYGLRIRMANEDGTTHDDITSYFAFRLPGISDTRNKFTLNEKPLFLTGYADAESHRLKTDADIREQLKTAKADGYNLIQLTGGTADERFYHWADRLGMIIWQASPVEKEQLQSAIDACANHPSIILWPSEATKLEKTLPKKFTAGEKNGNLIVLRGADIKLPPRNPPAIAIIDQPIPSEKKALLSGIVFNKKPEK